MREPLWGSGLAAQERGPTESSGVWASDGFLGLEAGRSVVLLDDEEEHEEDFPNREVRRFKKLVIKVGGLRVES